LAGIALVLAGLAKSLEICEGCPTFCTMGSCWITTLVSLVEIVTGVFVVVHAGTKQASRLAICTYLVLLAVAVYESVARFESCGCLGRISVWPPVFVALDTCILVLLAFAHGKASTCRCGIGLSASLTGLLTVGVWLVLLFSDWSTVNALLRWENLERYQIVSHDEWIDERLTSVFSELGIDVLEANIPNSGVVVFLRGDCDECLELAQKLTHLRDEKDWGDVSAILVPPYLDLDLSEGGVVIQVFKLSESRKWIVKTPLQLQIRDGKVSMIK
jgi:hypothetical protein